MKKRFLLTAFALLTASTMLFACGSKSSGTSNNADSQKTEQKQEANDIKEIHVQVGSSPETMDPALINTLDASNMALHAFEGLLKFDKNGNVIPALAEDYKISEDGLTWIFTLRENLKWSDGTPLTAKDFEYAWKRVADPVTAAPYGYDSLNMVAGFDEAEKGDIDKLQVEATDDLTFVVTLSNPCHFFDKIIASKTLYPVKQEIVEANPDSWAISPATYISSGAYRMTEFVDGDRIVLEKNENYYDIDNITFDRIVFHLMEDGNTIYTAYKNGELQMASTLPSEEIENMKNGEDFHLDPKSGTYFIIFNTEKEPYNDERVRQALSLVIDREYVGNTITQGSYIPATNMIGPGVSDAGENTSFAEVTKEKYGDRFSPENYEADVKKAQELLAEAGYPNGEGLPTLEYSTNAAIYHVPIAEYLQSVWKEKLGVESTLNTEEWKTFSANQTAGNFEISRKGWILDYDDPTNLLNLFVSTSGNNSGKFVDAEYDRLLEEAKTTVDLEKYYDLMHQAEQLLLDKAPMAPIVYYTTPWLLDTRVKNVWLSPYGDWYFMYGTIEE